jgi:hypothetical protein
MIRNFEKIVRRDRYNDEDRDFSYKKNKKNDFRFRRKLKNSQKNHFIESGFEVIKDFENYK